MTTPEEAPRPLRLADRPPPTPRRTLAQVDDATKATDARVTQMGSVVGTIAARLDVLTHDHDGTADETLRQVKEVRIDVAAVAQKAESLQTEVGAVRAEVERVGAGVLEAIQIGQRVEKRQKDDAAALRQSSSELERVTTDHSADIQRIRAIVAPLMAEASREGSARASKQVGVFGAIATTAAVVAPHVPWSEIGSAIARVLGG